MNKSDIEYLKNCLENTSSKIGLMNPDLWYNNGDSLLTIARILDNEDYFPSTHDVIYFFEKPYKYESDMQEIIDDFQEVTA